MINSNCYSLSLHLENREFPKLLILLLQPSVQMLGSYCSLFNYGVGVVLRSEFSDVKAGDHIYGNLREFYCENLIECSDDNLYAPEAFQNYFIKKNLDGLKVLENPHKLPWSVFVGVLGMPGKRLEKCQCYQIINKFLLGKTAYMGWKEYSKAKKV